MTYYNATFRDANLISYIERTTETNSFILRKRKIGKCLSFFIHFVVLFCAYYWHVGIHLYDVRIYNYNDVYVKPLFLLMLSTCTCACFDCFASWFIIGLNSIQCVYTIVHLDTVFNAKNKIGIYLICYYIHNIYLSFLHLMLYGISFSFVLSSHIADIIWKILIIDVRKDTLRRAVSNQSAFFHLYKSKYTEWKWNLFLLRE